MPQPFWKQSYLSDDISTFGIEPNQTIVDRLDVFKEGGKVLDVGCGEGNNAIFLAQKGFVVDAFDISCAGIEKLKRMASRENAKVNAWMQDLCEYDFTKTYDVIISFGTLHFVTKSDWKNFIHKAQENTNIGGIHIMQVFTNRLPAHPHIAAFVKGLAEEGELGKSYEDWNIVESKSYVFEDEHPGVEKHFHASNRVVAIK